MSTQKNQKNINPVCARLWMVRERSGLTDQQIILMSGRSNAFWHRLKYSTNEPTDSTIKTVADNMGVPEEWLRYGENEPDWEAWSSWIKRGYHQPKRATGMIAETGPETYGSKDDAENLPLYQLVKGLARHLNQDETDVWEKVCGVVLPKKKESAK